MLADILHWSWCSSSLYSPLGQGYAFTINWAAHCTVHSCLALGSRFNQRLPWRLCFQVYWVSPSLSPVTVLQIGTSLPDTTCSFYEQYMHPHYVLGNKTVEKPWLVPLPGGHVLVFTLGVLQHFTLTNSRVARALRGFWRSLCVSAKYTDV